MSLVVINLISKSAEDLKLLGEISTGTADTEFLLWRVHSAWKLAVGLGGRKAITTFRTPPWHKDCQKFALNSAEADV